MHKVTQTFKTNRLSYIKSRRLNSTLPHSLCNGDEIDQTAEIKKFRKHHSTLSQPMVQEIDMKNIEPTYFLDCDVLKSVIGVTPVNCQVSTSSVRSLSNWMKQNQGHFYCSETTQFVNKKKKPSLFRCTSKI